MENNDWYSPIDFLVTNFREFDDSTTIIPHQQRPNRKTMLSLYYS